MKAKFLTCYRVTYGSVFPEVRVGGLSRVDGPGGQVLGEADPEGGLREQRRVVVVVQHGAQHRRRGRQRPRAAVASLDCRRELQDLTVITFTVFS